jgi:hypothetical protein
VAGLKQKRNYDYQVGRLGKFYSPRHFVPDERVKNTLQFAARVRVIEYEVTHFLAIQRSLRCDIFLPEHLLDSGNAFTPRLGEFMGNLVGIDHTSAEYGKNIGSAGLTAADAPGQADYQHELKQS